MLGGIRAEADAVEHFDRLEPRTRAQYRMGAWASRVVVEKAIAAGERVAEKANRVFSGFPDQPGVDVLLMPTIGPRPRPVGVLDHSGAVRASLRSLPMVAWTALWNVTGNPAASVPVGLAPDGMPIGVQLVGRVGDEATLLALSAQLERERPWPLLTGGER
jgi:amidase